MLIEMILWLDDEKKLEKSEAFISCVSIAKNQKKERNKKNKVKLVLARNKIVKNSIYNFLLYIFFSFCKRKWNKIELKNEKFC